MEEKSRGAVSGAAAEPEIVHDFKDSQPGKSNSSLKNNNQSMGSTKPPIALFLILLVLGVGTGFLVSKVRGATTVSTVGTDGKVQNQNIERGQTFGLEDEKAFKDNAEGQLREGGIEGEGAYHLERPGGESQNVYLTSSSVDLSVFVGKKVKVWGETNTAQSAGWFMDVGRLQLL